MTASKSLRNAWEISERIQNLADSTPQVAKVLKNNLLRFDPQSGWFSGDDVLKASVGLLCLKAVMSDVLSSLGLAIIQFKHEGSFRFSGTCVTFGGVDSETMSYNGDSDTLVSHTTAWLCMADQQIRKHLSVD